MPAEVYSLHGSGASGLASARPEKKRALKYDKNLKRPVDANAPKKPLSAYFQWAAVSRAKVVEDCPEGSLPEITKKLGAMWRELPKDEKSEWEEKSKKQQSVYLNLMAAYKMTSAHAEFEKSWNEYQINETFKPFKKDDNAPKKSLSAYMIFAMDKRPEVAEKNPDSKQAEIMKLIGAAWSEFDDKQKAPFEKRAKEASKKFLEEKEAYQKSENFKKYVEEKKEYELRMKAKRERLIKGTKPKAVPSPAGSGISPKPKRRKTTEKIAAEKSKKKSSASKKKKKSAPKKAPPSAQVAPKMAKKKSLPKKSSGSKSKQASKKKVSKDKKKSEKKKARKNARTKSKK